jgi:molecular chaperone GrpE
MNKIYKIKEGLMLREVSGNYVVVAVGKMSKEFKAVITLNETGAFLFKKLQASITKEDLIKELIGVVDNFERAISLDDNDLTDDLSKFLSGFKIMYGTLTTILRNYGVEEISRVGEEFDPNLEEALLTDKVEGHKNEEVLEVLLKGYKLKDKVIRPASVKVNMI